MNYRLRERIGMWLQRRGILLRLLLRPEGVTPSGRIRAVNRISRHLVLMDDRGRVVSR